MQDPKLNGLRNQGATCYMNSLLQTLFMTPQFRSELYSEHFHQPAQQLIDNIPYQLQRLFLNLQYSSSICSTRKLIKSFQWQDNEKFQQHDVQQFCRVLFDAIENSSEKPWIQKNYAGLMKSYVRCVNGHSSERLENFLDLSLTIKNPFEGVENHSVEEAIKGYLKPEKLEYGNKYLCQQCGEKVDAVKGLEFVTLPRILTIQLKRFELNYETMQREKINEFVYYPQLLEMQRFLGEYEKIEVQDIPQELKEMRKLPPTEDVKKKLEDQEKKKAEKLEKLDKVPLKRKNSEEKLRNLEQVSFLDDVAVGKQKKEVLTSQEEKLKNIEALKNLKFNKDDLDKKFQRLEKKMIEKHNKIVAAQVQAPAPAPPAPVQAPAFDDLDDDILFGVGGAMIAQTTNWQSPTPKPSSFQTKKDTSSFSYSHKQPIYNPETSYKPNTFSLFAVLVHDGNAYSGHYYAYIKSGEQWYRFDDSRVTKASQIEVRKYGDLFKFYQGANAYMLFYRNVNTIKDLKEIEADEELITRSMEDPVEEEKNRKTQEEQIRRHYSPYEMRTMQKPFKVKLYYPKSQFTMLENVSLTMTVQELREIIKSQFNITEQDSNWRLRVYNSYQGTLLAPIEVQSTILKDLNLKQTVAMAIETKTSNEVFEQFDPRVVNLNINVWKQGLFFQRQPTPIKIKIRDDESFVTLLSLITQKTQIQNPKVLRRTFVKSNNVAQEVVYNSNSTLLGLRFFNNLILYVEEQSPKTKWQHEFDIQKYRVIITCNNPATQQPLTICYDNRKPFIEFKQHLSKLINIPINQFKVKLNESSSELSGRKRLSDLRIVGEMGLYLELGKSIKDIINISKCCIKNGLVTVEWEKGEQEGYEIEVSKMVGDLKNEIGAKHGLVENKIRVREYNRGCGEIFKEDIVLSQIKDRVLVWQQVQDDFRGLQIYTRLYKDQTLEPFNEIYVEYDATYQQLALIIGQNYSIHPQAVQAFSNISNLNNNISNLQEIKWTNINYQDGKIYDDPLYISTDGVYLIIKEGDKKVYKPKSKAGKQVYNYGGMGGGKQGKEKALTITVKKKQDKASKGEKEESQVKQVKQQGSQEVENNQIAIEGQSIQNKQQEAQTNPQQQ